MPRKKMRKIWKLIYVCHHDDIPICRYDGITTWRVIPFLKVYTALAASMKCENRVSLAIAASE